jgi:hypothetical protein
VLFNSARRPHTLPFSDAADTSRLQRKSLNRSVNTWQ